MRSSIAVGLFAAGVTVAQSTTPPAYATVTTTTAASSSSTSLSSASSLSSSSASSTIITSAASPVAPLPYSITTITSDDCTTLPDVTITQSMTETITYCSECEKMTHPGNTVHTTVWTTEWDEWCPNGTDSSYFTPHTYTITESCSMATPTWSQGPAYVPSAFTTQVQVCTMCGEKPVTATMTFPVSCTEYPAGVTGAPPAPASAAPTAPAATGSASPWSSESTIPWFNNTSVVPLAVPSSPQQPATAPAAASPAYASSEATFAPSPAAPTATPAAWGNTTGITPYTGGAVAVSAGSFVSFFSVICIAAGAFLL